MRDLIHEMYNDLGESRELCACSYQMDFVNFGQLIDYGTILWNRYLNEKLIERKNNEVHFHNFLKHQMFSHLQEMKFYSKVDITNTRRLVAVSPDCISTIQILIRDKIYLNTYFRSSDIDGALPADLKFITELPLELGVHLERMQGIKGYEEVTNELMRELRSKEVQMSLFFGSLHRTT